jgi:hypothetical protein
MTEVRKGRARARPFRYDYRLGLGFGLVWARSDAATAFAAALERGLRRIALACVATFGLVCLLLLVGVFILRCLTELLG